MRKKINIAFVGGGTGGHVYPIKSLLEYIGSNKDYSSNVKNVFWFGLSNSLEQNEQKNINCHDKLKIKFVSILSGKYRRETKFISRLKNLFDFIKIFIGIILSVFYLLFYKIDIIFSKGGFVALPVVLASKITQKKLLIHESDMKLGLTNKMSSKFANIVYTGFPNVFPKGKYVGQILSDELLNFDIKKEKEFYSFVKQKFDMQKTNLIVIGGSQGSKTIYKLLSKIIEKKHISKKYNIFIIGGLLNYKIKQMFIKYPDIFVYNYLNQIQMGILLNMMDVSITRAGTTSLAEQNYFNIKKIIIPIPRTHDQFYNAQYYKKNYNDIILDQKNKKFEYNVANKLIELQNYKKKINIKKIDKELNSKKIICEDLFDK